jgi:hypothetical protein
MTENINLTINGARIQSQKGSNVLDVALDSRAINRQIDIF